MVAVIYLFLTTPINKNQAANFQSALIMENCFEYLDAPVRRVGSLETPIPFVKAIEDQYLPKTRFEVALKELVAF